MSSDESIPVLGVVGGVGSGKSRVAEILSEFGCAVIDADRVGHEALREADIRQAVARRWPEAVGPDGEIDRKALAGCVFGDAGDLAELNAILHPRIGERIGERIARLRETGGVRAIVLDAAVLFEAGWQEICDAVLFVDAPADLRLERVRRTRGWDERQWRDRENSQISLDIKRDACEYIVRNGSSVSHLREQLRRQLQTILHPADGVS
jgi:dephospho-CoA kinase